MSPDPHGLARIAEVIFRNDSAVTCDPTRSFTAYSLNTRPSAHESGLGRRLNKLAESRSIGRTGSAAPPPHRLVPVAKRLDVDQVEHRGLPRCGGGSRTAPSDIPMRTERGTADVFSTCPAARQPCTGRPTSQPVLVPRWHPPEATGHECDGAVQQAARRTLAVRSRKAAASHTVGAGDLHCRKADTAHSRTPAAVQPALRSYLTPRHRSQH